MMDRRHFLSASFQTAAAFGLAPQASAQSNDKIERARQAALDTLKPTRAQIEHGLELQRQLDCDGILRIRTAMRHRR